MSSRSIHLNHINDLSVIKKPSIAAFKSVQLFAMLIDSFKKIFDIRCKLY